MSTVGVILSTVGAYHDACGGVQYCREEGGNLHYRHSNRPLEHCMEHHTYMGPTT